MRHEHMTEEQEDNMFEYDLESDDEEFLAALRGPAGETLDETTLEDAIHILEVASFHALRDQLVVPPRPNFLADPDLAPSAAAAVLLGQPPAAGRPHLSCPRSAAPAAAHRAPALPASSPVSGPASPTPGPTTPPSAPATSEVASEGAKPEATPWGSAPRPLSAAEPAPAPLHAPAMAPSTPRAARAATVGCSAGAGAAEALSLDAEECRGGLKLEPASPARRPFSGASPSGVARASCATPSPRKLVPSSSAELQLCATAARVLPHDSPHGAHSGAGRPSWAEGEAAAEEAAAPPGGGGPERRHSPRKATPTAGLRGLGLGARAWSRVHDAEASPSPRKGSAAAQRSLEGAASAPELCSQDSMDSTSLWLGELGGAAALHAAQADSVLEGLARHGSLLASPGLSPGDSRPALFSAGSPAALPFGHPLAGRSLSAQPRASLEAPTPSPRRSLLQQVALIPEEDHLHGGSDAGPFAPDPEPELSVEAAGAGAEWDAMVVEEPELSEEKGAPLAAAAAGGEQGAPNAAAPPGAGDEAEEADAICGVCLNDGAEEGNVIVVCDGCGIAVHQVCYGIMKLPAEDDPWFCAPCEAGARARARCELCPMPLGALKATVERSWVHSVCTFFTPGLGYEDAVQMAMVHGVSGIEAARRRLKCGVCKVKRGAPIQCAAGKCTSAFHVTCAQTAQYFMNVSEDAASGAVLCEVFCKRHRPRGAQPNYATCPELARDPAALALVLQGRAPAPALSGGSAGRARRMRGCGRGGARARQRAGGRHAGRGRRRGAPVGADRGASAGRGERGVGR